jgi:hypothetical protein
MQFSFSFHVWEFDSGFLYFVFFEVLFSRFFLSGFAGRSCINDASFSRFFFDLLDCFSEFPHRSCSIFGEFSLCRIEELHSISTDQVSLFVVCFLSSCFCVNLIEIIVVVIVLLLDIGGLPIEDSEFITIGPLDILCVEMGVDFRALLRIYDGGCFEY